MEMKRTDLLAAWAIAALISAWAGMVHATLTPQEACESARTKAAARYASCQLQAQSKYPSDFGLAFKKVTKCRQRYARTWPKLQEKFAGTGTTCDQDRFTTGPATITDNLTGLEWERKTNIDDNLNPTDPHDGDNYYSWSSTGSAADGTAFTQFLPALNGACFAGQCDWRLPTRDELQTILYDDPATGFCPISGPCIDPIFGPTKPNPYWSATAASPQHPQYAWHVNFVAGVVERSWGKAVPWYVRAVRGGL